MGCNMCVVKRPEEQYRIMFQVGHQGGLLSVNHEMMQVFPEASFMSVFFKSFRGSFRINHTEPAVLRPRRDLSRWFSAWSQHGNIHVCLVFQLQLILILTCPDVHEGTNTWSFSSSPCFHQGFAVETEMMVKN